MENLLLLYPPGIPCLVVLGPDLEVVNPNARNRVSNDMEALEYPWGAKVRISPKFSSIFFLLLVLMHVECRSDVI